jgi:hypothetical protein
MKIIITIYFMEGVVKTYIIRNKGLLLVDFVNFLDPGSVSSFPNKDPVPGEPSQ